MREVGVPALLRELGCCPRYDVPKLRAKRLGLVGEHLVMTDETPSTPAGAQPAPSAEQLQAQMQAIQQMQMATQLNRLYANGFIVAITASDIIVTLLVNGRPSGVLNMSFSSAKTLIEELSKALADVEKSIGHEIENMQTVMEGLQKLRGPSVSL